MKLQMLLIAAIICLVLNNGPAVSADQMDVRVLSGTFQHRDTFFIRVFVDGVKVGETRPVRRHRSPTWDEDFRVNNVNNDTMVRFEAWEWDIFTFNDLQFSHTVLVGDDILAAGRNGHVFRLDSGPGESLLVKLTVRPQ